MTTATEINEITQAKRDLTHEERLQFDLQLAAVRKDPTVALLLSLFFGTLGVDRFYIGDSGLGVAKLLTLGGLLIWALVDVFLIMGAARKKNAAAVQVVKTSILALRPR